MYIIDFDHSGTYLDGNKHKPYAEGVTQYGNIRYCSVNSYLYIRMVLYDVNSSWFITVES